MKRALALLVLVALALERPVVFDANLRLHRWPHPGRAASVARECVPGAFLVKANREEAPLLTGERDPAAGAAALAAAGPALAVVTLGADGAVVRGAQSRDAERARPGEERVRRRLAL
jgi:sugar/nucleoside kinase (ribokinase family)